MQIPLFIDVEASSLEENSYPIACAWSLPDGRIKNVLIIPEDDWEDWDVCTEDVHGLSREHLFLHGHTCKDVAQEMNEDLDGETVYCHDYYYDQLWIQRLFDAAGSDPQFELAPFSERFPELDEYALEDYRRDLQEELNLRPHQAEEEVHLLQRLYLRLTAADH